MRHVERHIVKENSLLWKQIDNLCFLSKNLYNYANYLVRQSFIFEGVYLGFNQVYHKVKDQPDYQALPRKVSQQVLKVLDKNWKSFFAANKSYKETPEKFTSRPKLPKYKHKTKGRNLLIYTIQAISKPGLRKGVVRLSGTDLAIPTKAKNIAQARLIIGQNILWKQEVNNGKKRRDPAPPTGANGAYKPMRRPHRTAPRERSPRQNNQYACFYSPCSVGRNANLQRSNERN